jgi:hypothetical protein
MTSFDLTHSTGFVHLIDREFNTRSFLAYDGGRVTHLKQLKQSNVIITVGVSLLCSFFISFLHRCTYVLIHLQLPLGTRPKQPATSDQVLGL